MCRFTADVTRMAASLHDNDIVAERAPGGRYVIRRWSDGVRVSVPGYEGTYDEVEVHILLNRLRSKGEGDTWIEEAPSQLRLIQRP
jgi:hypothetical protein